MSVCVVSRRAFFMRSVESSVTPPPSSAWMVSNRGAQFGYTCASTKRSSLADSSANPCCFAVAMSYLRAATRSTATRNAFSWMELSLAFFAPAPLPPP